MRKVKESPSTCQSCGRKQYLQGKCYCCGGQMADTQHVVEADEAMLRSQMRNLVDRMSLEELERMSEQWSVGVC